MAEELGIDGGAGAVAPGYAVRQQALVFGSPLDLFAIASTAFIVRSVAADGETTWFEGLLLVGVYLLFALAYYFESPG